MNREQTIEAIKVMQAWVDGKTIQVKGDGDKTWADAGSVEIESRQPGWQWKTNVYRVKPEPRTVHLAEFSDGTLGRHLLDEDEVSRYADPRMIRSTRLVKFVEVVEDEAKPSSEAVLPVKMVVPPSVRPLRRPFKVGDKGKTQGGWDYEVVKAPGATLEVLHTGIKPLRCYEMIHNENGAAGSAGEDHQLLAPEGL